MWQAESVKKGGRRLKGIFQAYGRVFLYVMLAGVLVTLALLAAKGVSRISVTGKQPEENKMQAAMEQYYQGAPPVITYTGGTLWMGEACDLKSCFRAVDQEDRELEIDVKGIWDSQGQEVQYPFVRSGCYRVEVGAQDGNGRSTVAAFWVPVNQGGI